MQVVLQQIDDFRQAPRQARVIGLQDQMAGVGVRHQGRKAIGLGVNKPKGVAVLDHSLTVFHDPIKAPLPKIAVHRFLAFSDEPQGNAGGGAVKGLTQKTVSRTQHRGQFTRRQLDLADQVVPV